MDAFDVPGRPVTRQAEDVVGDDNVGKGSSTTQPGVPQRG